MKNKKNCLTDTDKIFITLALWISMLALFATALTLPMLPDKVTIFYKTTDMNAEYYSKYNNLLIVFVSVIPAAIIMIAALLRRLGKMQHNFQSIILFGVILSTCMGGICIYGIIQQFDASGIVREVNTLTLISVCAAVLLSAGGAIAPVLIHSPAYAARAAKRSTFRVALDDSFVRYWSAGAIGFLFAGIISSFIVGIMSIIPVAVYFAVYFVFIAVITRLHMRSGKEKAVSEPLDA